MEDGRAIAFYNEECLLAQGHLSREDRGGATCTSCCFSAPPHMKEPVSRKLELFFTTPMRRRAFFHSSMSVKDCGISRMKNFGLRSQQKDGETLLALYFQSRRLKRPCLWKLFFLVAISFALGRHCLPLCSLPSPAPEWVE